MILVSLVACLLGIVFYVLDVVTDVQFSWEMLTMKNESREPDSEDPNITDVNVSSCILDVTLDRLTSRNISLLRLEECKYTNVYTLTESPKVSWMRIFHFWENYLGDRDLGQYMDPEEYRMTGIIALWHCIQPWLITIICFLGKASLYFPTEAKVRLFYSTMVHHHFCRGQYDKPSLSSDKIKREI